MGSIQSARELLENGEVLLYTDISALIDAFVYGTATPMMSLIKTTRIMYNIVSNRKTFQYFNHENILKEINLDNFKEFILQYFDEFVYKETINEDKFEMYQ